MGIIVGYGTVFTFSRTSLFIFKVARSNLHN
jgi:hypothetical protein